MTNNHNENTYSISLSKDIMHKKSSIQSNQPYKFNFSKILSRSIKNSSSELTTKGSINQKKKSNGNHTARNISNGQNTFINQKRKLDPWQSYLSNSEKVISLSNNAINALSQTIKYENTIKTKVLNKYDNKKLEIVKHDLISLAKAILNNNTSYEDIKSKPEPGNCLLGRRISPNKMSNSPQINKIEATKATKKKKEIHRNKSMIGHNDLNNTQMSLKRDHSRDLHHNSVDYNTNSSSSIIGNKIMSTFKDYEEAIQCLRKVNSRRNDDNSNSRSTIFNDKNKKVSLLKRNNYSTLLEEKEIDNSKLNNLIELSHKGNQIENDLRRQLKLKNEEIDALNERLKLNVYIDDISLSTRKNKEEENDQNVGLVIQELSNELKCKTRELNRLKEKDAKREKEIEKFYIKEMNNIKDFYEKLITKLKAEIINKDSNAKKIVIPEKDTLIINTIDQFQIDNSLNGQKSTEDNISILNNIINDLTNQIKDREINIILLQQDNKSLKSEIRSLSLDVKELTKNKLSFEEEILESKAEIEELLLKQSTIEKELNEELISLKALYDKTVTKNKIEIDELKDKVDSLISQKACAQEELYQCKIKFEEERNHQLTELNFQSELLEQENKDGNDAVDDDNNNDNQAFFNNNSDSLNEKDIQIDLLQNKIIVKSTNDTYNKEQSKTIKQLKEEHLIILSKKDEEINLLIKQIENITESCKILKKINKDKNDIVLDLKNKLTKFCDMRIDFEKEINKLQKEHDNKSNTILLLQDQLNQNIKKNDLLLSELESKVQLKNTQIDNLSTISLEKEKKIALLTQEVNSKCEEVAYLKLNPRQLTFSNTNDEFDFNNNQYQVKIASKPYLVLGEKRYKELQWYLISKMKKNRTETEEDTYANTFWIEGNVINEQLIIHHENRIQNEKTIHKQLVSMLVCKNQKQLIKTIEKDDNKVLKLQK